MKTKFPILIVASLLFVTVSQAQYARGCADPRFAIQAQIAIPGRAYVNYDYNNYVHDRYDGRREWRAEEYERFCREHRDWREAEYQRYCRENREFRGDRYDYYRSHYYYRPFCAPRRVVVY